MTRKADISRSFGKRMKDQEDSVTDFYARLRRRATVGQTISIPTGQGSTGVPSEGSGFLRTAGDTMIGPIAFLPRARTIATGVLTISTGTVGYSSYVHTLGEGATDDFLDTITGAAFAGQMLYMQSVSTTKITITNLGNIITSGGTDLEVAAGDLATLIFDVTVSGGGKWRVVGTSTGGAGGVAGANTALSNLVNPTSINQNLIPQVNKDLGSSGNEWQEAYLKSIEFTGTISVPSAGANTRISASSGAMDFNVDLITDVYRWYFNGEATATINRAGSGQSNITSFQFTPSQILFLDTAADPTSNGIFTRNDKDVKVFSGDSVRNLSDIGAAGGANVNLSNLSGDAVALNTHLEPSASNLRDLGQGDKDFRDLFIRQVRFNATATATTGGINIASEALTPDTMVLNVGTGEDFMFIENGDTANSLVFIDSSASKFEIGGGLELFVIRANGGGSLFSINKTGSNQTVFDAGPDGYKFNSAAVEFTNGFNITAAGGVADFNANNLIDLGNTLPVAGKELGDASNIWSSSFVNRYIIGTAGTINATQASLTATATQVNFNVPATGTFDFRVGDVSKATITSAGTYTGANMILSNTFALNDSSNSTPLIGQFSRSGSDVYIQTSSGTKNLDDIGSGGGGVTLPIAVDELEHGNVTGLVSIDLSATTAHYHTMTLIGDVNFTFTSPPASNKVIQFTLDITQDGDDSTPTGDGGNSISFNDTLETSAVQVKQGKDARTIIIVETRDGGATYSTFGSALTPSVATVGNKWSDLVNANIIPNTNNVFDLGSSGAQFKDIYIDGTANIDTLKVDVDVATKLSPQTDATLDLGTITTNRWRNLFLSGSATIGANAEVAGNVNINGTAPVNQGWLFFGNDLVNADIPTHGITNTFVFLDSSTGELSVKKDTGGTISLEASAAGGDLWGDEVDANIIPDSTANNRDLGSATNRFNNIWADAQATLGVLNVGGTIITSAGSLQMNGKTISQTGDITPNSDINFNAGSGSNKFAAIFTRNLRFNASTQFISGITGTGITNELPTGEAYDWQINNFSQMSLSNTTLDIQGNILRLDDADQDIVAGSSGIFMGCGSGKDYFLQDGDLIVDGGELVRAFGGGMGFAVTSYAAGTGTVGTEGTMQIPYEAGFESNKASADGDFGNQTGCIGVYGRSGADAILFCIKAADGDWRCQLINAVSGGVKLT